MSEQAKVRLWPLAAPDVCDGTSAYAADAEAELEAARIELTSQIDELFYVVAALLDRAGATPDPQMQPQHILGVRCEGASAHEAAA